MNVPFADLAIQYKRLKPEIDKAISEVDIQLQAGVITSSPGPIPNALSERKSPSVPLPMATQFFT